MSDITYPSAIINAILEERRFQNAKYGPVDKDGGHDLTGWLIVLQKELNEAMDAATGHGKRSRTGRNTVRSEILQIAAVAFAALEQHGLEPVSPLQNLAVKMMEERGPGPVAADGLPPSAPQPAFCKKLSGQCVYAACDCYEQSLAKTGEL